MKSERVQQQSEYYTKHTSIVCRTFLRAHALQLSRPIWLRHLTTRSSPNGLFPVADDATKLRFVPSIVFHFFCLCFPCEKTVEKVNTKYRCELGVYVWSRLSTERIKTHKMVPEVTGLMLRCDGTSQRRASDEKTTMHAERSPASGAASSRSSCQALSRDHVRMKR